MSATLRSAWLRQDSVVHKDKLRFDSKTRAATTDAAGNHPSGRSDDKSFDRNTILSRRITRRTEVSAGLLEIGLNDALHIREERLSMRHDACRLVYVSDIHLRRRRSDHLCRQVIESVRHSKADAVLLGGDLVDGRSELEKLCDLVAALRELAPVLAIGGNHDSRVGVDRVREAVERGGGEWIHDDAASLTHGSRLITVCGPDAAVLPDGDVRILCAHNPRVWETAQHVGYDLVLAGHLHGCQFVAFEYRGRLFPGAIFYPYCYLTHQRGSTRLVVSRGISDLVPVRWRCPREVVLCYV